MMNRVSCQAVSRQVRSSYARSIPLRMSVNVQPIGRDAQTVQTQINYRSFHNVFDSTHNLRHQRLPLQSIHTRYISTRPNLDNLIGKYQGKLEIDESTSIPVTFSFEYDPINQLRAQIMVQGYKFPVNSITYSTENFVLEVKSCAANFEFQGKYAPFESTFDGIFIQGDAKIPLKMEKITAETETLVNRPQTPQKPFPYKSNEVKFHHEKHLGEHGIARVTLGGTLTLPKRKIGKFPVVVLVCGSGIHDRDEEIFEHRPFAVIADYLTRKGVGVLRYDDRSLPNSPITNMNGVPIDPELVGGISTCTTLDFASDVKAAVQYLRLSEIGSKISSIGVIGHSEGGIVASIAATQPDSPEQMIDFLILLGTPSYPGDHIVKQQTLDILQSELDPSLANQFTETLNETLRLSKTIEWNEYGKPASVEQLAQIRKQIQQLLIDFADGLSDEEKLKLNYPISKHERMHVINQHVKICTTTWYSNFLKIDPTVFFKKLNCNVFGLYGEKDLQVKAEENAKNLKECFSQLSDRQLTQVRVIEGLNHLFQKCTTGSPREYHTIEETFNPVALEQIYNWITMSNDATVAKTKPKASNSRARSGKKSK